MIDNISLGKKIKSLRIESNITQNELAQKLGVSYQAISNWERGISQIDIDNIIKLGKLFSVSLDYLLLDSNDDCLYLGIDGGGTKTEFLLCNQNGEIIYNFKLAQSNPNDIGMDRSVSVLEEGINRCLNISKNIKYCFAGVAGLATGDNKAVLSKRIHDKYPSIDIDFDTDIENLFYLENNVKSALIIGTGSVLFVKDNNVRHQFGGWGYMLDHYGSGYDIGNAAIRTLLDEKEKGKYVSKISKLMIKANVDVENLIHDVYLKGKSYVASYAHFVFEAYKDNDAKAKKIINDNVMYLRDLISKAQLRYDLGNKILLAGGIIEHYSDILIPLLNLNEYEIVVSNLPQIIGASRRALSMNNKNNDEVVKVLIDQYIDKNKPQRKQGDINITSCVKVVNGIPRLFINDEITAGDSYITYITDKNNYQEFSNIGFNVFSVPIYFASRTINESTQMVPFCKGIFESKEGFSLIDLEVNKLLKVNKNAYIFFRLDTSLPVSWDKANQDELNDEGACGNNRKPCIASDKYIDQIKCYLKQTIEYIQNQPYADLIFGYQIAGLNTQEWLAFDNNGNEGKAMRDKYQKYISEHAVKDSKCNYYKFRNEMVASRIVELSHYVKELTEHRLVVGSFYGYVLAVMYHRYGHLALHRLLESDDIDFLCAPIAYYTQRSYLNDNPLMTPLGSLNLHGKLYFTENDTRTDLTVKFSDQDAYNTPIWRGPSREFSLEMCKMHFASSLCRNHTYWWFDMFGHWYNHKDYYELFAKFLNLSKESLKLSPKNINQVAVITDVDSLYDDYDDGYIIKTNCSIFPTLGCIGVGYDVYLSDDFDRIKNNYKCFIILEPKENENIIKIKNELKNIKLPYLTINGNVELDARKLKKTLKSLGISTYFDQNVIVYENEYFLFIHSNEDTILPKIKGLKLIDLLEKNTFPLHAKKGHGYLFKKIKA